MWTIWPIFIFLYHKVHSASDVHSCGNDEDCSQGSICQNNVCKECIKCALLFRNGNDCERDFNDCGSCLPGYKEISTTNSANVVKPCRPEKLKSNACTNDEDCPIGTYCHEKFCTDCFNCSLLNKLPPNNGCAKESNTCGFCMDGFHELPVTTNSNIKICGTTVPDLNSFSELVWSTINVLPICILLIFATAVIKHKIKKHREKRDSKMSMCERPLGPSAPPLFESDIPESILCQVQSEKFSVVPRTAECKQQANAAIVFKYPDAPYYFAEESGDDASDHSNDNNEDISCPLYRSEPEEVYSLNIFTHRYVESFGRLPSVQEPNENVRSDRQFNVSEDNIDSENPAEDVAKILPQPDNSNAPKS